MFSRRGGWFSPRPGEGSVNVGLVGVSSGSVGEGDIGVESSDGRVVVGVEEATSPVVSTGTSGRAGRFMAVRLFFMVV